MTEQVVVEFIGDPSGLKPAIDILEKVGSVDKKTADQFKKSNADYQERVKATTNLTNANKSTIKSVEDLAKAHSKVAETIGQGVISKEYKDIKVQAEASKSAINDAMVTADKGGQTAKQRLREMKNELNALEEAGKGNSKEFRDLSVKAGQLSDQIGDINNQIRILGSDTKNIDTLIEVAGSVTASFFLAKQATKAFGIENEALDDTLGGVEATIATLNSLQTIGNAIKANSIANTVILDTLNKSSLVLKGREITATAIQNGLDSSSIVVRYAAAAAQRVLNSAMLANPVLLIVSATAALVGILAIFGDSNKKLIKTQEELNLAESIRLQNLADTKKELQEVAKQTQDHIKNEIALAEASGKSKTEIRALEKKLEKERINSAKEQLIADATNYVNIDKNKTALKGLKAEVDNMKKGKDAEKDSTKEYIKVKEEEIALLEKSIESGKASIEELKKARQEAELNEAKFAKEQQMTSLANSKAFAEAQVELAKEGSLKQMNAKIAAINAARAVELANADLTAGEITLINVKAQKEIDAIKHDFMVKGLEDQKKETDEKLLIVAKGSESELKLKIDAIKQQSAIDLQTTGLTEKGKKQIITRAEVEIAALQLEYRYATMQAQINADISHIHTRLLLSKEGSKQELIAKKDLIDAQAFLDIESANKSILNNEERAAKILEINTKAAKDKAELDKTAVSKEISLNQTALAAIVTHQKAVQQLILNDKKATIEQKAEASIALLDIELNQKKEEEKILEQKRTNGDISDAEYLQQKQALADDEIAIEQQKQNTIKDLENQRMLNGIEFSKQMVQAAQEINQALLDSSLSNIEKRYAPEEERLQRQIDIKKKNHQDETALQEQLDALQKKRQKEETEAKRKSAIADKALGVFNITLSTAEAIIKALANPGGPAGVALSVAAGITGAAQLAAILAKPIPAFATGTPSAPAGFKWVGERGPELINTPGGHAIITNEDSMKLLQKYNLASKDGGNLVNMPVIDGPTRKILEEHSVQQASSAIDYDKLGKTLAKYINSGSKSGKHTEVHINEKGFMVRVQELQNTINYFNTKYSSE